MLKKEKIPFLSSKILEAMKDGGLIGVLDKGEWTGILNHCLLVRRVATYLAQKLKAAGENVNLSVVSEAALLHDVGRRQEDERILHNKEFNMAGSHARKGAKILEEKGFPKEISEIIESHHFPQKKKLLDNWEKKVVFYADMRVAQSILSFNDRIDNVKKGWVLSKKITRKKMNRTKKIAQDIEQEIFSKLDIDPDNILDLPMPGVERYIRDVVKHNLEDKAINFFRGSEDRKAKKKTE